MDPSGSATPAGNTDDEAEGMDADEETGVEEDEVAPVVRRGPGRPKGGRREQRNIKGTTFTIIDDELQLEEDARGEEKIDDNGNLLGDRQYKVYTFTSPKRANPDKVYMLSIDAARASGFRDSLYFFRRNPLILKLNCSQYEKDFLIARNRLSSNLKSRAVTMVSARNVFKVMGAKFVMNGKYVFDDYYEDKAIAAGHKPGEPAFVEPYDLAQDSGIVAAAKGPAPAGATGSGLNQLYTTAGKPRLAGAERDQYLAVAMSQGLGSIFGGSGIQPFGKVWNPYSKAAKPPSHLSIQNWMHEYAKTVTMSNRLLAKWRRRALEEIKVGLNIEESEEDLWIDPGSDYEPDSDDSDEDAELPILQLPSKPVHRSRAEEGTLGLDDLRPAGSVRPSPSPLAAVASPALDAVPKLESAAPSPMPEVVPEEDEGAKDEEAAVDEEPKERKKIYNPTKGIHNPYTNTPHVQQVTQPTKVVIQRLGVLPALYPAAAADDEADEFVSLPRKRENGSTAAVEKKEEEAEDEKEDEEPPRKRRKKDVELLAASKGLSTVEYVVDDSANYLNEPLLPGMWDFRSMIRLEDYV